MTVAHELGHVVLRFPDGCEERNEEQAVKSFAGAFLLPKRTFIESFGRKRDRLTVRELVEIKRQFGVSIMGIMKRAVSLELISETRYKTFCFFVNKWGWRSKGGEPGDNVWTGCEEGTRFPQLVRRAMAEELISSSKGAALLGIPLAEIRDAEMCQLIE
jgi:Zn-dependent peptidase ImmA (M78 family)